MKHPFRFPSQSLALAFTAFALAHGALAQETISLDEAQKIAQKLAAVSTAASDQPFTVEIDADKPVGIKGGDAGLIVLPDKRFNAEALAAAGKTITPVAQLWVYKVNLANNGIAVESAKLRTLTVGEGDKTRDVQLFLLGVTKNEQGAVELVVFAKGSEPVMRASLTKASGAKQDFPIEISGRKTGEDSAALTLNLTGQLTGELGVVKAN